MKKIIRIFVTVVVIANMTGCASTKGYFIDRGRDGVDIFTCSVGLGLGAKARIGPAGAGLMVQHDMAGLRRGQISINDQTWNLNHGFPWIDYVVLCIGSESCNGEYYLNDARSKSFHALMEIPFVYTVEERESRCAYYTQIEAVIAPGPSLRLGFNPGELLDFILGWTTIDILKDDLEAKKQKEKSN